MSQGKTAFDHLDFFTVMEVVAILSGVLSPQVARIGPPVARAVAAVLVPIVLAVALVLPGSGSEGVGGWALVAGGPGVLVSVLVVGTISLWRGAKRRRQEERSNG